jgi:hypothetical protein
MSGIGAAKVTCLNHFAGQLLQKGTLMADAPCTAIVEADFCEPNIVTGPVSADHNMCRLRTAMDHSRGAELLIRSR